MLRGALPVMTLISGTLSGDRFTERAFLSKASLSILFLVAEPQSLYRPVARNNVRFLSHVRSRFRTARYSPMISRPLLSTSSTQRHTIIGTFCTPIARAVETPPGTPPVLVSRLTCRFNDYYVTAPWRTRLVITKFSIANHYFCINRIVFKL